MSDLTDEETRALHALREMSDDRLLQVLTAVFKPRLPFAASAEFMKSRFFVGVATSDLLSEPDEVTERWSAWTTCAIAECDQEHYAGRFGGIDLCQEGTCDQCGITLLSTAKNAICPICDSKARLT
jgi:rubrerythrin